MYPPFQITVEILNLCAEINRLMGQFEGLKAPVPQPQLRRQSRIKTIFSSLAIEGNRLTEQQVTDIINNKRVLGPQKDIIEVKNAIKAYDMIHSYKPDRLASLLKAHQVMLNGLAEDAGSLRVRNVGIFKGEEVAHLAPKYQLIPKLMGDLFAFLKRKDNLNPLIKSSVFHYELEFIHPFSDGNGRMGRLWQTVVLLKYHTLFEYIPVESIVREKQKEYYKVLAQADKEGDSTRFIKFMLEVIFQAAREFLVNVKPQTETATIRLKLAGDQFQNNPFSRKDYLAFHKNISTATASRDLFFGVKQKILQKSGYRALTTYRF
ncbi:cell filamentation protein Fic [candidate division WOR-1 bacterium RIFOXYC2_FULL_37_10]|uniref:Cell filamentation protein Fic n=1 Tax=candidate division WOR-1 bacterium RIFOXYB2_FULL_37_13 TaxID=1802579 RepID=A0A1F4SL46_UNCSA|nr:MAG: cell filamentation protein Fic [candidate division WOR-1 bacterium RIFOXYA2_FULL_37_7]OGC21156.1 MAG: cell filamentation protein Fic [candidate division WOR-1 bacterium RIFOXYB2_FULL_37_13]OGC36236.1 MAG: cell filamentation protein Fic [candidate division WOR-1 bacterium RIFOXYC2_FULL_37_10]